ncbi:MAG: AAA family ATPase, partial [Anaerolineales bacterium]|nr:AAA family ATPase [Anaerolineales bacterium]
MENDLIYIDPKGIRKVIWATTKRELIWTHEDHHINRTYIGKVWQNGVVDTYTINNKDYLAYFVNQQQEKGILAGWTDGEMGGVPTASVRRKPGDQYLEVRSYAMAYQTIAMCEIVRKYNDKLVSVRNDDIWIHKGYFNEPISTGDDRIPGQWKPQPPNKEYDYQVYNQYVPQNVVSPVIEDTNERRTYSQVALTYGVSLQRGAAGTGKTFDFLEAVKEWSKKDYVYLTPTKILAKKKIKEYPDLNAMNWQRFFGSSWADPDWLKPRPNAPNGGHIRFEGGVPKLVIWDEIYTCDDDVIEMFLTWLLDRGATIILIGDDAQLEPFNGRDNVTVVKKFVDYEFPIKTEDRRSKDEASKRLKQALRYHREEDAVKIIEMMHGKTKWNEFLDKWTPESLVYATTHAMTSYLTPILQEIHRTKYPKRPVPYLFTADTKYCDDIYHNNEFIAVPLGADPPPNTTLAYTTTVAKCIGDTVKDNIFIIADRNSSVFSNHGVYTAVTRIEYISQLHWVTPDDDSR